ncbi:MAG TPA: ribonuclease T [Permianibacter sp.]|nr:ribonuclease T [Permianibacter sp.]
MTDKGIAHGTSLLATRFRGFYPVIVDVETGGFNARTDALLEIAATLIEIDDNGILRPGASVHCHVEPFAGANIEAAALAFTGIDPTHPFRFAVSEKDALHEIFQKVRHAQKLHGCHRTVLVGHNAWFDLAFLNAAIERTGIKRSPFHPFTSFDTATLAGLAYGQTVLAKACAHAGIDFDGNEAHSAVYDAEKTADLFCRIVNRWQQLGAWPPAGLSDADADDDADRSE